MSPRPVIPVAAFLACACASPAPPPATPTPPVAAPALSASPVPPAIAAAPIASAKAPEPLREARENTERRKREHREHYGPWVSSDITKWRGALDGYVSLIQPGNQLPLSEARRPFAIYLVAMHNRIHPLFAEWYLDSLDDVPAAQNPNEHVPVTGVEIVLSADGHIKQMGVVRPSGLVAFDIAVLDSIDRAQPFGQAPSPILSADGNVYIHWDFHREETFACSTMNVHPFLRRGP